MFNFQLDTDKSAKFALKSAFFTDFMEKLAFINA